MARYRTVIRLAIVCAASCVASAAAAASEAPADDGDDVAQRRSGNPLWAIPLDALSATRDRPVFSISRRPPPPVVTPVVAVAAPPPPKPAEPEQLALTLRGTVVGREDGIVIGFNPATGGLVRVRMGEDFEGWILRSVRAREAIFQKGDRQALIALPSPDDPPSQLPAMPASSPAAVALPPRLLPPEKPQNPATAPPWGALLRR